MDPLDESMQIEEHERLDDTVIWGTNVSTKDTLEAFRNFILNFRLDTEDEHSTPHYIKLLHEVCNLFVIKKYSLN